jgi:diguanylate cyclase (GGDEF)-like protein
VALEIYDLQEYIRNYENEYGVQVLFIDKDGQPQIESGSAEDYTSQTYTIPENKNDDEITVSKSGSKINYTITKYIEPLDWYMVIQDINPYDYTADYMLIAFNVGTFIVFLMITTICLRLISERAGILFHDSYQDKLTGFFNRRAYDDDLSQLREQKRLKNIIIVAFDVNGLKKVNDSQGHLAGDELITGSAKLIYETFAPYGKCYRIGGDEFMAILDKPEANIDFLTKQFEKALSGWRGKYVEKISVSYGMVSTVDPQYQEFGIDELISFADEQMYRKKQEYYSAADNDRRKR